MLSQTMGITYLGTTLVTSWWQINVANETVIKHVAIDSLPSPVEGKCFVFALLRTFGTLTPAYL